MKKLPILGVLIMSLVIAIPAFGDVALQSEIVRPNIDTFRVTRFQIVNNEAPYVLFNCDLGYATGSTFNYVTATQVKITNYAVFYGRQTIASADSAGELTNLPAAYQTNPANKVISEINNGTFGNQTTARDYLELIIQVLIGL